MFSSIIATSILAATVSAASLQPRSGLSCTKNGASGVLKVKHTQGNLETPPAERLLTIGKQTDAQGRTYLAYTEDEKDLANVIFEVCSGIEGFETGPAYGILKVKGSTNCLTAEDYSKPYTPLIAAECGSDAGALANQWFKVSIQGNDTVAELVGKSSGDPKRFVTSTSNPEGVPAASGSPYSIEYFKFVIEDPSN